MKISDYVKPIGWTRDTNLSGYVAGTYDVLAVWPKGPDKEVWSNVGIYTQAQVEEILKRCGICEDLLRELCSEKKFLGK
jgi:hypothetical protein